MNRFSYYIITHFIPSNKYYNSYRNSYSVYQTYPKLFINFIITKRKKKQKKKDHIMLSTLSRAPIACKI